MDAKRKADLLAALQSLRKALSAGQESALGEIPIPLHCLGGKDYEKEKFPHLAAVKLAADKVRWFLRGGDKTKIVDDRITTRAQLLRILRFLDTDIDAIDSLPGDAETVRTLVRLIDDVCGKKQKRKSIPLLPEDMTLLDKLAQGYPEATNQYDLADATNIPRRKVSERLQFLESKKLVARPENTKRKGHAITQDGLKAIDWPMDRVP